MRRWQWIALIVLALLAGVMAGNVGVATQHADKIAPPAIATNSSSDLADVLF